jgi:hypothetical protein
VVDSTSTTDGSRPLVLSLDLESHVKIYNYEDLLGDGIPVERKLP